MSAGTILISRRDIFILSFLHHLLCITLLRLYNILAILWTGIVCKTRPRPRPGPGQDQDQGQEPTTFMKNEDEFHLWAFKPHLMSFSPLSFRLSDEEETKWMEIFWMRGKNWLRSKNILLLKSAAAIWSNQFSELPKELFHWIYINFVNRCWRK